MGASGRMKLQAGTPTLPSANDDDEERKLIPGLGGEAGRLTADGAARKDAPVGLFFTGSAFILALVFAADGLWCWCRCFEGLLAR